MKRRFILLAWALFPAAPAAGAHDTVTAGRVSVEWHTDTNEKLQVNADTTFSLAVKVQGQPLKLNQCRCTLLLYPGEVSARVRPTVLRLQAAENGEWQSVVTVSKAGTYSVVLDGKPLNLQDFAAFRTVIRLDALEDVYNIPKEH